MTDEDEYEIPSQILGIGTVGYVSERRPTKEERKIMQERKPMGFVQFPICDTNKRRRTAKAKRK